MSLGNDKHLDTYINIIFRFPLSTPECKENIRKKENEGYTKPKELNHSKRSQLEWGNSQNGQNLFLRQNIGTTNKSKLW